MVIPPFIIDAMPSVKTVDLSSFADHMTADSAVALC